MTSETKDILTDSVRYWELRRILYNIALVIVSIAAHLSLAEAYRQKLTLGSFSGVLILAVVANLFYCAAYIPDIALQLTAYRNIWLKVRIGLFVFGTLFASLLAFLCVAPLRFE